MVPYAAMVSMRVRLTKAVRGIVVEELPLPEFSLRRRQEALPPKGTTAVRERHGAATKLSIAEATPDVGMICEARSDVHVRKSRGGELSIKRKCGYAD